MREKGFTLLEILVSAMIMALVMVGLANIFLMSKRHLQYSRSKIQTAELGKLFLEPLQMDVRQDEWASNCLGSGTGCPSTPADNKLIDNITYRPRVVVNQNVFGTTLYKVTLTINWDEL